MDGVESINVFRSAIARGHENGVKSLILFIIGLVQDQRFDRCHSSQPIVYCDLSMGRSDLIWPDDVDISLCERLLQTIPTERDNLSI
jgi:hypothetical protein